MSPPTPNVRWPSSVDSGPVRLIILRAQHDRPLEPPLLNDRSLLHASSGHVGSQRPVELAGDVALEDASEPAWAAPVSAGSTGCCILAIVKLRHDIEGRRYYDRMSPPARRRTVCHDREAHSVVLVRPQRRPISDGRRVVDLSRPRSHRGPLRWVRTCRSDQPTAVEAMREVGIDITGERPKQLIPESVDRSGRTAAACRRRSETSVAARLTPVSGIRRDSHS